MNQGKLDVIKQEMARVNINSLEIRELKCMGMGKFNFSSVQFSPSFVSDSLQPHEQYERQKDMTLKDEFPRSVGVQYATGEEWRNSSRRDEKAESK